MELANEKPIPCKMGALVATVLASKRARAVTKSSSTEARLELGFFLRLGFLRKWHKQFLSCALEN